MPKGNDYMRKKRITAVPFYSTHPYHIPTSRNTIKQVVTRILTC